MKVMLALGAVLLGAASPAIGQGTTARLPRVKLALEDAPRLGRPAPLVVLPYATAAGIGPVDQPFALGKELGNIVVLAFYPGDFTPASTAQWRAFRERADSLFGTGVVVVGVASDSLATHQRFAQELELPFKLLGDADHTVARRYAAMNSKQPRHMVVVVGRDGRVRYVDSTFAPLDPERYVHLATAIAAAKERP
ncbi:MAG: redoxin domain-containing protein [Gemmatimonadales bacterium]